MTGKPANYKQRTVAVMMVAVSVWLIWEIGCYGSGEWYADAAERENSVSLADKSVQIYPNSADPYFKRGYIYQRSGDPVKAATDYEYSLKLRPEDYFVWLQLGLVREKNNDETGAIDALRESVRLAPFYGQPRWHLGRLLLQVGRAEEGWIEIRKAFTGDPPMLLAAVEMAWIETRGKADEVKKLLQLENKLQNLVFGIFLIDKGATVDTASLLCDSSVLSHDTRQNLISRLLGRQEFRLAYMVETGNCQIAEDGMPVAEIKNGSFEEDIPYQNNSFDWQLNREQKGVQLTRSKTEHQDGSHSLQLNFDGNPTGKILRQLVLVEPQTRYRLSFTVQTKELITDSYPRLAVLDAANSAKNLAVSELFDKRAEGWTSYEVEFKTAEQTEAAWVSLERQECRYRLCPIFGTIWLDNLELNKK